MASSPPGTGDGSLLQSSPALALPPSITSIKSILDEEVDPKKLVNIVGLVKDFSPPIKTRGTDFKAKMWLYDASVQRDEEAFEFAIFRREKNLIPDVGPGDVVYVQSAKVQRFRSDPLSCITTLSTRMHVFKASRIPKPPEDASRALDNFLKRTETSGRPSAPPSQQISKFVSVLYHSIDRSCIPDIETFKVAASQALQVKEKFQELWNINDGAFFDFIVQVIKEPFDQGDCLTLWVTDYTENPAFYEFSEESTSYGFDTDPMGYGLPEDKGWKGPFGKMSLQITCWDPHASIIRSKATKDSYIRLRNVQIKFGKNGANLEGYLRQDMKYPSKVNVEVLNLHDEPETLDPRLKELLRRKRDHAPSRKRVMTETSYKEEESIKRKADVETPKNVKSRRAKKRAKRQQTKGKSSQEQHINLNQLVCCENMNIDPVSVSSIFEPIYLNISTDDGPIRVVLPFGDTKYRVIVRVIDFRPNKLENFARARKASEFDILSDNDEDPSDYEADSISSSTRWEWAFMLLLEDASIQAGPRPGRVWATVDNEQAQYLTGLNASDLRNDTQGKADLESQMTRLWGNLEKKKRKHMEQDAVRLKTRGDAPPDDSDEDTIPPGEGSRAPVELYNEAFPCCLKQYGTKNVEEDPGKADAGDGKRWQRRYKLFGTKIQYLDPIESR